MYRYYMIEARQAQVLEKHNEITARGFAFSLIVDRDGQVFGKGNLIFGKIDRMLKECLTSARLPKMGRQQDRVCPLIAR